MIEEWANWPDVERVLNPPVILPPGYCIMDTRPGALNVFRPLYGGNPPRPLATLAAFELTLRE